MTFTFNENLTTDKDWIRFKTGDVVADESYLSDELIAGVLSDVGTKQKAAVACARHIILRLAQPRVREDWQEVDPKDAVAARMLTRPTNRSRSMRSAPTGATARRLPSRITPPGATGQERRKRCPALRFSPISGAWRAKP
jgi:hypothetical protein